MRALPSIFAAFVVSATSAAAQVPAAGEFRVNTTVQDDQGDASAAAAPNGDFVVVWTSRLVPLQDYNIFGQLYTADGARRGGEFRVNSFTTDMQRRARVAMRADGSFVVVWMNVATGGISAQRFDPAGGPLGGEFRVNSSFSGTAAAIATDPRGNAVVTWWSSTPQDPDGGVFARLVSPHGVPQASEFRVNTFTTFAQIIPEVAMAPSGDFVVAWVSALQDGSSYGVFGQRFSAAGTPVGAEFMAPTGTVGAQRNQSVDMDAQGNFVIVWDSYGNDGSGTGVFGQKFLASGARFGAEFRVNTYTSLGQFSPRVRMGETGAFVVTWSSFGQDGSNSGTFGQRFFSGTSPRGPEFRVNTFTTNAQYGGGVAADPAGNFTVTWSSMGQDGSGAGVYAQRYGGLIPAGLRLGGGDPVLEAGEAASLLPTWRNVSGAAQTLTGTLAGFGGPPPGGIPIVIDPDGDYATIPNGAAGEATGGYGIVMADPVPRPAAHWDGVVMERLQPDAQGQDKLWVLHIGESFSDVAPMSPFYPYVETAYHHGVMVECAPGQFCPTFAVPREQMAQMVLTAKSRTFVPPPCVFGQEMFGDVPASSPYCPWIEELVRRGVIAGCGGGNYCPLDLVTRESLAVYVLKTLEGIAYVPPACGTPVFADMPPSSPFCRWVEELARRQVVTGCGGGNYCPAVAVSREQMAVFIGVTFGLTLYGV